MKIKRNEFFLKIVTLLILPILAVGLPQCTKSPTNSETLQKKVSLVEIEDNNYDPTDITTTDCDDGIQPSGALYRICMPDLWNNDLVVWAHGYVDPREPLEIPDDEVGGRTISEIVNMLGYAYATTSFRANGLIVPDAVEDLVELIDIFVDDYTEPEHIYLVGASEGGLITALTTEQYPHLFDGGLAACGPVGDFRKQLNYFGNFRVVFDYLFPGIIPGSPVDIPQEAINNWDAIYEQEVLGAIRSNPHATEQLLQITYAPSDPFDPASIEETVLGALRYNVFATNNAVEKLGGQPFDNRRRIYRGSDNDFRLNQRIQRFHANQAALDEIEARYQTSGDLDAPLVTIHTTKDEIVPYWHEPHYRWKLFTNGSGLLHANIPVCRYGHCNFRISEVLAAFAVLVFKVTMQELIVPEKLFSEEDEQSDFIELAQKHGLRPQIVIRSALQDLKPVIQFRSTLE